MVLPCSFAHKPLCHAALGSPTHPTRDLRQLGAPTGQKRPDHLARITEHALLGNTREAVEPHATSEPEKHRLRLIVSMMPGENDPRARRLGRCAWRARREDARRVDRPLAERALLLGVVRRRDHAPPRAPDRLGERVAALLTQLVVALDFLHDRGVVHRDIKPANIRIGKHGSVKLMDFGIAKASVDREAKTQTNTVIGSFPYMSPERFDEAGPETPASDVFSLGCCLYYFVVKKDPFEGANLDK